VEDSADDAYNSKLAWLNSYVKSITSVTAYATVVGYCKTSLSVTSQNIAQVTVDLRYSSP